MFFEFIIFASVITVLHLGGRNMMLKAGLRKEHTSMVDWMNSHGGRSGESIMLEEDLFSNGYSLFHPFS